MSQTTIKLLWPEYEYKAPAPPSDEKKILFHQRKKDDQFWRKQLMPDDIDWTRMNSTERARFIDRERERWVNGVHFFNNGEIEYITGKHYDHLTFQTFDYSPRFLKSQQHSWYFRDLVKESSKCYGGLKIKPRRDGDTDEEVTDSIYEATCDFDRLIGMMSDTREKVYETLYDKITSSYLQRPEFMRPEILMRNGMVPRRSMKWLPNKITKKGFGDMLSYDMSKFLRSSISPKGTTVMGYDGRKVHKLTLDEIWKWIKVNPYKCWDKQKKCLFDGGIIIGYAMLLSTMGDDESYDDAIQAGIDMWYDSNPAATELDKNGFTKTGLWRYFIAGPYAIRKFADKFGYINMDRATEYILEERSKLIEGSLEWLFEVRKFPLTIEEALGSALSGGVFDSTRIQEQITLISKLTESEKPYIEATLQEDNKGVVHIQPEKSGNGPWILAKPIPSDTMNRRWFNRFKEFDGRFLPPLNPEGCVGYDPIRYAEIDLRSGSVSQASIIGRYKFDYFNRKVKDHYAGLYLNRPENSTEAHRESFKFCKLYNFMLMHEAQVESVIEKFRLWGADDFVLLGPDGKPGIWTTAKVIKKGTDLTQDFIRSPKIDPKTKQPLEDDRLKMIKLIEFLKQLKLWNPKHSTIYDAMMSNIMLELGMSQIYELNITDDYDPQENYNNLVASIFSKGQVF